jgi:hypothetical protein
MNSLLVALFALIASTFQTRVALQAEIPPPDQEPSASPAPGDPPCQPEHSEWQRRSWCRERRDQATRRVKGRPDSGARADEAAQLPRPLGVKGL